METRDKHAFLVWSLVGRGLHEASLHEAGVHSAAGPVTESLAKGWRRKQYLQSYRLEVIGASRVSGGEGRIRPRCPRVADRELVNSSPGEWRGQANQRSPGCFVHMGYQVTPTMDGD